MKTKYLVLLFIIAGLLAMGLTSLFYTHYIIHDVMVLETHVEMGDYVGINADTDKLWFGTVYPGGKSERKITLRHTRPKPSKVDIQFGGQMANWLSTNKTSFYMHNENKTITFTLKPPYNTPMDNYTGVVRIFFKRW